MSLPNVPLLQPSLIYGLRTDILKNAHFLGDEEVVYPAGGLVVSNNFAQKRQRFFKLPDRGSRITRMLISPNQKLIVVAEKGERPSLYLYDAETLKKKRQLQIPSDKECSASTFEVIQFTFDSKTVFGVSGEPDWTLYAFKCDKGKLESLVRGNNLNGTGTVADLAANTNDSNLIALVGKTVFKIMACQDAVWRQYGYNKADTLNLTSAAWVSQDRLLVGSAEGKFMFFESGDLKVIFWAGDLPILNLKTKEKEELAAQQSQTNISEPSIAGSIRAGENYEIHNLIVFSKGIVFNYLNGTVHLYEKENPTKYVKRNVFKVPDHNIIRDESDAELIMNEINSLSINASEDALVISCQENQLYRVRLWGSDMTAAPEIFFTELGSPQHHGPIGGMDVCSWKPIFITTGAWDRTVRVWNYEDDVLELFKQFQEDVYGVALHPTGLYTVVGFSDKLRFLTITIDDFVVNREFPIRNCKECSFSTSGQYFAATNGILIQVFSTITFENVFNLKGHNGRIHEMHWTVDDFKMVSCGEEGAVYEWDTVTSKRVAETIIKTCAFTGVNTTVDGKSNYAVGSDGYLRELINSNVTREVLIFQDGLDTVGLSHSNQMIFVSGNEGVIYSIKLPLMDQAEYLEFGAHSCTITRMAVSFDDRYLITCSKDALICVWKLLNVEGKTIKMDKDFVPSTDVLISRQVLVEKLEAIKDLTVRMHELRTEHSYQMRNVETLHGLKLKEVHEGYCLAIEDLREKNETLEAEHAQEISTMNVTMMTVKQEHEEFLQKMEISYNDKLIQEYDKFLRLEDKMANMRKRYETELEDLRQAKKISEETITNDFLAKLHEKEVQVEELFEEAKAKTKEHELIKQQIEDDADREIYELKSSHERQLKEEQDNNVRLRGETGIIRKKLLAAQKEVDELKHTVYTQQNEQIKLKTCIVGLEKDIADLKKEIVERDATIQDKEKRAHELKRKNAELEKFKFILDFKIKELKSQIEPRDRQIREQTEQINDMVNELENLQKVIISLDIQLSELREKLRAADNELKREIVKNRAAKAHLKTIRMDLHQMSGYIHDIPKLKKAVKDMYHKYNADKDFSITQAEDVESKNEFLRQRDFLEHTVKTLQTQVGKFANTGNADKVRLVDENATLVEETNGLRKALKNEVHRNRKMESLLGLSSKYMLARQAQKRLNDAVATTEEIHEEYRQRLQDEENTIYALKEENTRLASKIINQKEKKKQND